MLKPVLVCVWDHCPFGTWCPKSSCWLEVKLKILEVVLLLNYYIHCVQCSSTTGGKTASEYDGTMLDSWYIFS